MEFPIVNTGREHVDRFVNEIAPLVCNEYIKRMTRGEHVIYPSTCIAQAALESGWNVNAKTLFGIKGDGFVSDTTEYIDGTYINIQDSFKCYPNAATAIQGFYDLIQNDLYRAATKAVDWVEECKEIYNCGYATDPTYSDKLINITETNNLTVFNDYCLALLRGEDTAEETDNSGRIEELADKLENGDYGNGRDIRVERTAQDGYTLEEYEAAQKIVNERS